MMDWYESSGFQIGAGHYISNESGEPSRPIGFRRNEPRLEVPKDQRPPRFSKTFHERRSIR